MKRVAAGAHLPDLWLLSLRNAQTIEPTTAWTAVFAPSANTKYSPSNGTGRAPQPRLGANSGEVPGPEKWFFISVSLIYQDYCIVY